jgi:hypothetical protein
MKLTISNNTITRSTQGNEGIIVANGTNGQLTALIQGNTTSGLGGTHIFVGQVPGNATSASMLDATISGNNVTMPSGATNHGIIAFLTSTTGQLAPARIEIDGNTVVNNSTTGTTRAILVDTPDSARTPSFHATVSNNSATVTDAIAGVIPIVVQCRNAASASLTANIFGNTTTVPGGLGINGLRARQNDGANYNLEQSASCTGTAAAVLACRNPGATTEVLGTINVVAAGSTQTPSLP